MLDLMRKHAGTWLIKVILGAVIVVFVFWGVGSYRLNKGTQVAEVNGKTITIDQYREVYNSLLDQLRQNFGNNLTEEMIETFNVRAQALNQIIDQTLLLEEAQRLKFRVSDQQLAASIQSNPAFQSSGRFDPRRYRQILNANRLTPESFEIMQRKNMLVNKVRGLVQRSIHVSEAEAKEWYRWSNLSINVDYVVFEPESYKDIQVTGEEIENYFNDNKLSYKTEPKLKARFLRFSTDAFVDQVHLPEDEIIEYYESNPDKYRQPKTVEARHILLKVADGASSEQEDTVRNKALEILNKIQSGEDFAEAAKQYSEGPSKDTGGYLGTFKKEDMVEPFAEKAFSLAEGEVSEPVRTQFGWHIIKTEKINPATTVSLAEAKDAIRNELAQDRARTLAGNAAEDAFDVSFDEPSLARLAEMKGLPLQVTDLFAKKGPEKLEADAEKFAAAAFNLKNDEISEIQEVNGNFYIIQVTDRFPEKVPALADVESRVKVDLIQKRQLEKAKLDAESLLKAVGAGQTLAEAGKVFGAEPKTTGFFKRSDSIPNIGYESAIISAVFQLSEKKPLPDNVIKGRTGFYVLRFKGKKYPDDNAYDTQQENIKQRLLQQKEMEALNALLESLKKSSEITIAEAFRE